MAEGTLAEKWKGIETSLLGAEQLLLLVAPQVNGSPEHGIFREYLSHNELGLAFEALEGLVDDSGVENREIRGLLAGAAENMGRNNGLERE